MTTPLSYSIGQSSINCGLWPGIFAEEMAINSYNEFLMYRIDVVSLLWDDNNTYG